MAIITGLILLLIGLVACFFGWRFFRLIMGLQGFVIGYYLAQRLLVAQGEGIALIVGIILGVILFFIFYMFLYNLAFVVFGAILGLAIGALIDSALNVDGIVALVIALVLAVIGAVIGNMLSDVMIRISTAFAGAAQAVSGVGALAAAIGMSLPLADPTAGGANTHSTVGIVTLVVVVVLGLIGFFFQSQNAA